MFSMYPSLDLWFNLWDESRISLTVQSINKTLEYIINKLVIHRETLNGIINRQIITTGSNKL